MIRARAKRLKDTLNGLIKDVLEEERHVRQTKEEPRIIHFLEIQSFGMELGESWFKGRRPLANIKCKTVQSHRPMAYLEV